MTSGRPRIVVGIAGSPASDAALRWAVEHAAAVGADVEAVAVWQSRFAFADPAVPGGKNAAATIVRRLPADVRAAARHGGVELRGELALGHPSDVLVRRSRGALMLVLGNGRRGGLATLLRGSVAGRCARAAGCPVVLVPVGG